MSMVKRVRFCKIQSRRRSPHTRKPSGRPTLQESKAVIALAMTIVSVFAAFTYYMGFRFQYPSDVLAMPPFGSSAPRRNSVADRPSEAPLKAPLFKLTSAEITDGGQIPTRFTCAAGKAAVTPPLRWSDAPRGTASFVVIVRDAEPVPGEESG